MLYYAKGSRDGVISAAEAREALHGVFDALGPVSRVLAIPPDHTRLGSFAGPLTAMADEYFENRLTDIMPALGTHSPMSEAQIRMMFGEGIPLQKFRTHDWRRDVETVGTVPSEFVGEVSRGRVNYDIPMQVNRLLLDPSFDLILSIGQVVPHEVVGMANHSKNIFVGLGGPEGIGKSHFLGASYGMERIMGRARTPVRDVLEYSRTRFIPFLPILYILTVRSVDEVSGSLVTRGLFIGDDFECFERAAALSLEANFTMLERPVGKCVVYLDPSEFRSTWLGNKAIYRTRMALADGAELVILAPGLKSFGEDRAIDALIREYGYTGTSRILAATASDPDLKANLGASAHLIHGSSEGRFKVTYCPGPLMGRGEIEGVGFAFGDLSEALERYPTGRMKDGWNALPAGEEVYYISNPALGLWAHRGRFVQ